jgi:hypothetical protein
MIAISIEAMAKGMKIMESLKEEAINAIANLPEQRALRYPAIRQRSGDYIGWEVLEPARQQPASFSYRSQLLRR